MIPWSRSCNFEVVFTDRNSNFTFSRAGISPCVKQLSMNNRIFLFCFFMLLLTFLSHEQNTLQFIHAFMLTKYFVGKLFTFLKHCGFKNFPITNGLILSFPVELTHSNPVIRSLQFFHHYMYPLLKSRFYRASLEKECSFVCIEYVFW